MYILRDKTISPINLRSSIPHLYRRQNTLCTVLTHFDTMPARKTFITTLPQVQTLPPRNQQADCTLLAFSVMFQRDGVFLHASLLTARRAGSTARVLDTKCANAQSSSSSQLYA